MTPCFLWIAGALQITTRLVMINRPLLFVILSSCSDTEAVVCCSERYRFAAAVNGLRK
jgi:hypothetical protein